MTPGLLASASGVLPGMEFEDGDKLQDLHCEIFFASLIGHVDPCSRILSMPSICSVGDDIDHYAADGTRDTSNGGLNGIFLPLRDRSGTGRGGGRGPTAHLPIPAASSWGAARHHYGPSALPMLDAFIESVCCGGGVNGRIRSWAIDATGSSQIMIYNMKDNR